MRSARFLPLVIVGLVLGSTLPLLAAEPAPLAAPAPTVADTITLADLLEGEEATADPSLFEASGWSCPWYTQICTTSSQCDAYCGGVGWGECISFGGARRCCACNT